MRIYECNNCGLLMTDTKKHSCELGGHWSFILHDFVESGGVMRVPVIDLQEANSEIARLRAENQELKHEINALRPTKEHFASKFVTYRGLLREWMDVRPWRVETIHDLTVRTKKELGE